MQEVKRKSKHHWAVLHFADVVKLQYNCDIRETWFNLIHETNILRHVFTLFEVWLALV